MSQSRVRPVRGSGGPQRWLPLALAAVALLLAGGLAGARLDDAWEGPRTREPEQPIPSATTSTTAPTAAEGSQPAAPVLRWAPPTGWRGFEELRLPPDGGRVRLDDRTDYRVVAPRPITGPVELVGGRHVVWVGGHIHVEADGGDEPRARAIGLLVRDGEHARKGRVVHLEGLLLDGAGLTEGVNLDAPSADVQIQNLRVEDIRFAGADDRDGTGPYDRVGRNHPDVLQTFGGHRVLRVDGLTGRSGYQGIFLKVDHADGRGGPVHLRRVDLQAIEFEGEDGFRYAGNRMYFWDARSIGDQHLERGTVWIQHHPNAGKVAAEPNPRDGAGGWWHGAYRDGEDLRADEPPGSARFTDAAERLEAGAPVIEPRVGRDELGRYLWWPVPRSGMGAAVLDATGLQPGRIYDGTPPTGEYVPRDLVGVEYDSPGYGKERGS